jgi:hypothetical protein
MSNNRCYSFSRRDKTSYSYRPRVITEKPTLNFEFLFLDKNIPYSAQNDSPIA